MVDPQEHDNSLNTESTDGGSVGDTTGDSELTDDLDRLKHELNEAKDRYLRSQAELENFRRRTRRDIEDERKFSTQALLSDLLPVLDNIERAIDAANQANQADSGLLQGFQMVHHQLLDVLERHNCPRVSAVGENFDPTQHEAVAQEPSTEFPKGVVVRVNLNGYKLHDRIIRPAQVVVSTGPPSDA